MSTDGTKPPSIAPKKSGARVPRPTSPRGRTGSATTKAATATEAPPPPPPLPSRASATSNEGTATEAVSTPSMGDRLKQAGRSVSDAARGAVPKGDSAKDGSAKDGSAKDGSAKDGSAKDGSAKRDSAKRDSASRPQSSTAAAPHIGPRRVRLSVAKIDPWSVMKLSFLLSIAMGIMLVVAAAVIWYTLDAQAVFTQVDDTIAEITGDPEFFDVLSYMSFERVLALATVIAVVDIVLLTALSTIGAFLYNIVSALVGGINVTLTDD